MGRINIFSLLGGWGNNFSPPWEGGKYIIESTNLYFRRMIYIFSTLKRNIFFSPEMWRINIFYPLGGWTLNFLLPGRVGNQLFSPLGGWGLNLT